MINRRSDLIRTPDQAEASPPSAIRGASNL